MKKISLVALLLSFIVFGFSSCKPTPPGPTVQTLSVGPESISSGTADVTFSADQNGDGSISSLTLNYGSKDTTINNPSMPWSYTANGLSGDVSMTAKGTISNGKIKIIMQGYGTKIGNFIDADSISMSSSK